MNYLKCKKMIKLKPSNIFDHYAPTGCVSKIANFGITIKKAATPAIIPSCEILASPSLPNGGKKDYTWVYILGTVIVITGIIIAVKIHSDTKKDKENKFES